LTGCFSASGSVGFVVTVSDSEGKATCTQRNNLEFLTDENLVHAKNETRTWETALLNQTGTNEVLAMVESYRRPGTDPSFVLGNVGKE